jgi:hypothetical protein
VVDPFVRFEPEAADYSLAVEGLELCRAIGYRLDLEQELVLSASLARDRHGRWASFEVCDVEPRQNGKGDKLEAREIIGVVLAGDELLIHSAHEYATALEAFYRMLTRLEEAGDYVKVQKVRNAHGEQGIDFVGGARLRYRTRTKGGGRGFSCDFLGLDEAMHLPEFAFGALLPTMSARRNPQVFYAASAVDQDVHEQGIVLARVRERGISRKGRRLAYFEWSLPYDNPEMVPREVLEDPAEWRKVNPAMAYGRIREEHVASELASMGARTFAVERLGVGEWPATDGTAGQIVNLAKWGELEDPESEIHEPIVLAWDVSPDRHGAIAAAGRNARGLGHLEIVDARQGTAWLADRLVELVREHEPLAILCDERGPGAHLIAQVEELLFEIGYELTVVKANENAQACAAFIDAVNEETFRHLGDDRLTNAIRGASTRPLGDSFSWARRSSAVNIAPLFAGTLALWDALGRPVEDEELVIY